METPQPTTPVNRGNICFSSPGTPLSLLRRSSRKSINTLDSEVDGVESRQTRRRSYVADIQRSNEQSPALANTRSHHIVNEDQVTEHYAHCIRLCSENKVTMKNAFSLHLIDYMADMIDKEGPTGTNFQIAGCTVDAGVKIYAYRVDSLFGQTQRILGSLGSPEKEPAADGLPGPEAGGGPTGKTNRRKRASTVVTDLRTITTEAIEVDLTPDPLFQRTSAMFDSSGTSGLLLNNLGMRDDGCELLLNQCDELQEGLLRLVEKVSVGSDWLDRLRDISTSAELRVCPSFEEFTFTGWSREERDDMEESFSIPPVLPDLVFDPTGGPNVSDDDEEGYIPVGGEDEDEFVDDAVGVGSGQIGVGFGQTGDRTGQTGDHTGQTGGHTGQYHGGAGGSLDRVFLDNLDPDEYSYFNPRYFQALVAPNHWKLAAFQKKSGVASSSAVTPSSTEVTSSQRRRRVKFRVDFSEAGCSVVDWSRLVAAGRAKTALPRRAVQTASASTLPPVPLPQPAQFLRLFTKENYSSEKSDRRPHEDSLHMLLSNNGPIPTSNEGEPQLLGYDDDDDDFSSVFLPADPLNFDDPQITLDRDELIAQPWKAAKIQINYAKTDKRVNMAVLKRSMWRIILDSHPSSQAVYGKENLPSLSPGCCQETRKQSPITLSQEVCPTGYTPQSQFHVLRSLDGVLTELPNNLPRNLGNNLTLAMAFSCLLHLANERELFLYGDAGMLNVSIYLPADSIIDEN